MKMNVEELTFLALEQGFSTVRILAPDSAQNAAFLVCALPYGNNSGAVPPPRPDDYAVIAPFARFNYYGEAVFRLKKISLEIRKRHGGKKSDFRIFCNSRINEKQIAHRSGLGSFGRNGLIITREAGSLVILAMMSLPNVEIDSALRSGVLGAAAPRRGGREQRSAGAGRTGRINPACNIVCGSKHPHHAVGHLWRQRPSGRIIWRGETSPFPLCISCDAENPPCKLACPTGAVRGDGSIDLSRCIQWFASGNGETPPDEVRARWGRRLYGCTDCQDACPHNKKNIAGAETARGRLDAFINIHELLAMTDADINHKFKGTALGLSWLGAPAIRRNALCVANCGHFDRP
jgi:epoxyqueuosine reductase